MPKLPEWEGRLAEVLRDPAPFEWGKRDCALFAADCVEAQTGDDPAAHWRGTYTDEGGAYLAHGGDLAALASVSLALSGWRPHDNPAKAHRGDIVAFLTPDGDALGVVDMDGRHIAALSEKRGLIRLPLRLAHTIWSID